MSRPLPIACRHRGMTLVELVTSMAIMSVVVTGLASALVIASHALPGTRSPVTTIVPAAEALDQIADDLHVATAVKERGSQAVTVQVHDRDGDGQSETIRYAWSGIPGDSLSRQHGDIVVPDFLQEVYHFAVGYRQGVVQHAGAPTLIESNEALRASYYSSSDQTSTTITSSDWIGQVIYPILPANAVNWRATRVTIALRRYPLLSGGRARVELQVAAGQKPSGEVLASTSLSWGLLSLDYAWRDVEFESPPTLLPDQGACVLVRHEAGAWPCDVVYRWRYANLSSGNMVTTSNGGGSWMTYTDRAMIFYLYGTVTVPGPPAVIEEHYLGGVEVTLQTGAHESSRLRTSVGLLNRPEVPAP